MVLQKKEDRTVTAAYECTEEQVAMAKFKHNEWTPAESDDRVNANVKKFLPVKAYLKNQLLKV